MRVRFSIDKDDWRRACEYAEATHRTPSGLIVEALDQMQARYPRKGLQATRIDMDAIVAAVVEKMQGRVLAGTLSGTEGRAS